MHRTVKFFSWEWSQDSDVPCQKAYFVAWG
jgi:hypothetical protein